MPEIAYINKNFSEGSESIISRAREICEEYAAAGYGLTLRQLYYQFVSRDWIANRDTEYKRLGSIINDARLAGMLDWDYISDRTRNLESPSIWASPEEIVEAVAKQFKIDKWAEQDTRIEAWIEKDALTEILEAACQPLDVPYFSCRGYTSQSEIWGAAQRLGKYIRNGQQVVILHLGDHDPSGIDMTRDIEARLSMFIAQDLGYEGMAGPRDSPNDYVGAVEELVIERIALNRDQIRLYNPPPNPAKLTDVRARGYVERHGSSSWELDALEPRVLVALIRKAIRSYQDSARWTSAVEEEEGDRKILTAVSDRWNDVKTYLAEEH
jgi:hypothetical protein